MEGSVQILDGNYIFFFFGGPFNLSTVGFVESPGFLLPFFSGLCAGVCYFMLENGCVASDEKAVMLEKVIWLDS